MFNWIKSFFADISAGSVRVTLSLGMVIALLVALGKLASQQPDAGVLAVADDHRAGTVQVAASSTDSTAAGDRHSGAARRSTVSVMVPVASFR